MRVVFAGTPDPAVAPLKALLADSSHEVVAVVCRPDAPTGRGRSLKPCPVKQVALENGIEVLTPTTLRAGTEDGEAFRARVRELAPDCVPVVAYGQLIPDDVLALVPHGFINLHFSILPAWRGAAPVQAAIAHGDEITGATTFRIDSGLDTGPVLGVMTEEIRPGETAGELLDRLSTSGAELLLRSLEGLESGTLVPTPQEGEPTYAPKITTEDARIQWDKPAFAIDRAVRAHTPAPGAWTMLGSERIKVGQLAAVTVEDLRVSPEEAARVAELEPGEVLVTRRHVLVGTGTGVVELRRVQAPGKKMMNAADWARGRTDLSGARF